MIAILKFKLPQDPGDSGAGLADGITGWVIAADVQDAQRQLPAGADYEGLGDLLSRMEQPKPGKHLLPVGDHQFLMLVT